MNLNNRGTSPATLNLLFRIVGPHQHRAVVGADTYICAREITVTETGLSNRWVVLKGDVILKQDCRTLNEAKNLCRAIAFDNGRTDRGLPNEQPARPEPSGVLRPAG